MKHPRICGVITDHDEESIRNAERHVDLFELRLDLLGRGWPETARLMAKPWIATNRLASEGGRWSGTEAERINALIKAVEAGSNIVDVELSTPGLGRVVGLLKNKATCLISHHNMTNTPPLKVLKDIVKRELDAGADICKVASTALTFDDNAAILSLLSAFTDIKLVALAMGEAGQASRILGPLTGGDFTYASLNSGAESAPGQLSVAQLAGLYGALRI